MQSSSIVLIVAVLLAVFACGRIGFENAALDNPDAAAAVDSAQLQPDATESPFVERRVECETPLPVLATVPTSIHIESSLHSDNLTLISRRGTLRQASRPTTTGAFSNFVVATLIPTNLQDAVFIDLAAAGLGDSLIAIAAIDPAPSRELVRCIEPSAASECEPVLLFDEAGISIVDDVDGPSLAVRDGQLLMLFNRDTDVYLGRPRDLSVQEWDVELLEYNLGSSADPAILRDGSFILAPTEIGGIIKIMASQWNPESQSYGPVTEILGLRGFTEPASGIIGPDFVEIFVTGETRAIREPHRSLCTVSPVP